MGAHHPRVVVGGVAQPARRQRGLVVLDVAGRHPPRPVGGDPAGPPILISPMRGVLEGELFLQTPARLKETIGPVVGDRASLALALGLERAAALAYPGAARDEPLRI